MNTREVSRSVAMPSPKEISRIPVAFWMLRFTPSRKSVMGTTGRGFLDLGRALVVSELRRFRGSTVVTFVALAVYVVWQEEEDQER